MAPNVSFWELSGIVSGVGFAMLLNFGNRRPLHSGIYKHAAFSILGYFGGQGVDRMIKQKTRERLLIIEDYIRLHPEDFPEEVPLKYGDILVKWYPVR